MSTCASHPVAPGSIPGGVSDWITHPSIVPCVGKLSTTLCGKVTGSGVTQLALCPRNASRQILAQRLSTGDERPRPRRSSGIVLGLRYMGNLPYLPYPFHDVCTSCTNVSRQSPELIPPPVVSDVNGPGGRDNTFEIVAISLSLFLCLTMGWPDLCSVQCA